MEKVFGYQSFLTPGKVVGRTPTGEDITLKQAFLDPLDSLKNSYITYVLDAYDATADEGEKLDIITKEFYIAAWGNGLEAYNMIRRTGKPANLQPGIETSVGDFIRSAIYPAVHVNLNANVQQKSVTEQVFWDTNPPNFVK
ncbi:MAG: SusD/RagB family nutrient-binding outer membrane lipoprotein [Bacteroidia bacterium]